MSVDLSTLPEPVFVDTDTAVIEAGIIGLFETITGRTLAPADPERLFCESLAYIIAQQHALINDTGKQNLLAYARGANLEALAALLAVARLAATAAATTLEFTLTGAQATDTTIPAGTRAGVVADGVTLMFALDAALVIPAGETTGTGAATCQTPGAAGNGFITGQIGQLIDSVPLVASVQNTVMSLGGSDAEIDEHLRTRTQIAPESFSVAGPYWAYVFHALSADADIINVGVDSPTPGAVTVVPLMTDGQIPDTAVLDAVEAVLLNKKVRPLTDNVTVSAPSAVSYDITLTYYIWTSYAALASTIQAAVNDAITAYQAWQRAALGRDLNPAELTARIMAVSGVKRVAITAPVYTPLDFDEVAAVGTVTATYGGLEA